jgi:hypothetical protein
MLSRKVGILRQSDKPAEGTCSCGKERAHKWCLKYGLVALKALEITYEMAYLEFINSLSILDNRPVKVGRRKNG